MTKLCIEFITSGFSKVYIAKIFPVSVTDIGIITKHLCNFGNYSLSSEITIGNCKKIEHT